jgi:prepilin-type N-terminal cleavage/methylation domain-containing protein/prepilin-type processing-associated H-X9-DG protein
MRPPNASLRRGFTLVELLVVVGIIALLIAILLPTLHRARMAGQRAACQNNVRQLFVGVSLYCDNNHDWFPTAAFPRDGAAYAQYADDWLWWEQNRDVNLSPIGRYLNVHGERLQSILRCPADTFDGRATAPGQSAGQGPYLYSYSINQSVGVNEYPGPLSFRRTKRSQWHRPAEKILLTEVLAMPPIHWASPIWGYVDNLTRRHGQAVSQRTRGIMGVNVNAAFMDGHVQGIDEDFSNDVRQIHPFE